MLDEALGPHASLRIGDLESVPERPWDRDATQRERDPDQGRVAQGRDENLGPLAGRL